MVQEAEREKAKGLLSRFKNDHMTKLLDLLDIPRSELKDKVCRLPSLLPQLFCLSFPSVFFPAVFAILR